MSVKNPQSPLKTQKLPTPRKNPPQNPPDSLKFTSVKSNSPQPSIIPQNCENVNNNSVGQTSVRAVTPQTWVYSDIVKEHFLNPRNFLMGDETKYKHDADGIVGNPVCGDQMKMYLRIQNDKITDVKWKTYGCASAIASTSALSELAKGKTLDEALQIGPEEITAYLGGLPKHKFHCSVLGHEALAAAIQQYRKEHSQDIPEA